MDLDGDGRRDILSGSYSRMDDDMAGLFQVLRGKEDGTFRKAEVLKGTDGEPLIIPLKGREMTENICTRPFAIDWDGDAKLDLVVGTFAGTFYVFKGQGEGKFAPEPEQLMVAGEPLQVEGYHGDPFVIDWDGDGDLDVLSGSARGGVQWAENQAGPGKPSKLHPFRRLIEPGPPHQYNHILRDADLKGPSADTRIWVDDVDSDGKLDILVGDMTPLVSPAAGLTEAEFKTKLAEWTESLDKAHEAMRGAGADTKRQIEARDRIQKLYEKRSAFMNEDRTGFVWLYLQK